MAQHRRLVRVLFVAFGWALALSMSPDHGRVHANPVCDCGGVYDGGLDAGADAYLYNNTYEGSAFGSTQNFSIGSLSACASFCQGWVNSNVGDVACDNAGLESGQGYVIENWSYFYDGGGDTLQQQYDCGDVS
jgi:hypothetical protein